MREAFAADPPLWALWLIFCRALLSAKTMLLGVFLETNDVQLGPGSVVRGSKCMTLGRDIRARSGLHLEAITRHGQQRFKPILQIEDDVCFSNNVHISCIERVVIHKGALMGSHIFISDHDHGIYQGQHQSLPAEPPAFRALGGGGPVLIGQNAWIGDNVVIVGPVTIGDGAIIAANSVVRHDVEAETMVAGIPARVVKRFDQSTHLWERV
jgi:acetyltransferase-like isoleucine patch superfamily enzyme